MLIKKYVFMRVLLIFSYAVLLISCDFEANNNVEQLVNKEQINRAFEISQIFAYQNHIHKESNLALRDTLLSLTSNASEIEDILEVNKLSNKVLSNLNSIKLHLIKKSGGLYENGTYKNIEGKRVVEETLIRDLSKGDSLFQLLNNYSDFLNKKGVKVNKIASTPPENMVYKFDKRFKNKSWGYIYFKNCNLFEAITIISYLTEEVLRGETYYYQKILIAIASKTTSR